MGLGERTLPTKALKGLNKGKPKKQARVGIGEKDPKGLQRVRKRVDRRTPSQLLYLPYVRKKKRKTDLEGIVGLRKKKNKGSGREKPALDHQIRVPRGRAWNLWER